MIDFFDDQSHVLLNPRLPDEERRALERLGKESPSLRGHVWIATSGTTGAMRLVALSKRAILVSAEAVNRHLGVTAGDVWVCVLPTFHVGGLGIYARAALTRSPVIASDWNARQFMQTAAAEHVTLASLVPAQVRDLVAQGEPAPSAMRAIVVGGGEMPLDLYSAARSLGCSSRRNSNMKNPRKACAFRWSKISARPRRPLNSLIDFSGTYGKKTAFNSKD